MKSSPKQTNQPEFNLKRLPPKLQTKLTPLYKKQEAVENYLKTNKIYLGDARKLLPQIEPNSIALSVWSPPYFVGKDYEADLTFKIGKICWKMSLNSTFQLLNLAVF